jgi:RNA polymerase sigma factor (sigma-70 family)
VNSICDRASGASCPAVCAGPVIPAPDEDRVAALFEQYHRYVVAWACRITGSYELARDLAQDVFIKAWSGIERFRGDAQFTTWLYAITRNRCHDYLRARAARPREVGDGALAAAPPVVENDAVEWVEAQHAATLVRRLIRDARLDPIEEGAFRLHYGADVPLQVVTRRLGLTNASGARARLASAKRKLRRSAERWQRCTVRARAGHRTA